MFFDKKIKNDIQNIIDEVTRWEGVTSGTHRFGGIEFNFGKAEIGHIHINGMIDIPFQISLRNELIENGVVKKHHYLPDSGWISYYLSKAGKAETGIELLKLSYLRYKIKKENENREYLEEIEKLSFSEQIKNILKNKIERTQHV